MTLQGCRLADWSGDGRSVQAALAMRLENAEIRSSVSFAQSGCQSDRCRRRERGTDTCFLAGKQKESNAKARGGERFQHLQLLQGLDNDVHRCVTERRNRVRKARRERLFPGATVRRFFPRLALLAQLADELEVRGQNAVKGPATASMFRGLSHRVRG